MTQYITRVSDWNDTRWPNFRPNEFVSHGNGQLKMDVDFLDLMQEIRSVFGNPIPVTSGYRDPDYNASVASTGLDGPHTTGQAADISMFGTHALELVKIALNKGVTGLGVKQHGPHAKRFVHLDIVKTSEYPNHPRPWIWSY